MSEGIKLNVNIYGLANAESDIIAYRERLRMKMERLLERLATLGATQASLSFSRALYAGKNDVVVSVERTSETSYSVVAEGAHVLFIEFGSGTSFPNYPSDAKLQYPRGVFGKGQGSNPGEWVYVGEQGNAGHFIRDGVYRTTGNPPSRSMYDASKDMRNDIERIAREVFAGD